MYCVYPARGLGRKIGPRDNHSGRAGARKRGYISLHYLRSCRKKVVTHTVLPFRLTINGNL